LFGPFYFRRNRFNSEILRQIFSKVKTYFYLFLNFKWFYFRKIGISYAVIGYVSLIISGLFGLSRVIALVLGYSGVVDTYRGAYQVD